MRSTESMILGCLFLCLGCTSEPEHPMGSKYLLSVDQLNRVLDEPQTVVLDLRKPEQYATGHIPGAISIWRSEMQDNSYPYQGVMGTKSQIEALFGAKGIASGSFLVMYDDRGACESARMWWILKYYGYEKMAILNGGLQAWLQNSEATAENPGRPEATFRLPGDGDEKMIASMAQVGQFIANGSALLLDARTRDEYSGQVMKKGASLAGRVPGSIHLDWMEAVTEDHQFKSLGQLEASYDLPRDRKVVTYCHSGVRSAHTYFVLTELLDYEQVMNYDGSWVEWSYHAQPVERDTLINQ